LIYTGNKEKLMENKIILGILVPNRLEKAPQVQKVLTKFGCNIKTRLGLHEVNEKTCSVSGLIIIELFGDETECIDLEKQLRAIHGIQIQKMLFEI
jgi:hypothetical protein